MEVRHTHTKSKNQQTGKTQLVERGYFLPTIYKNARDGPWSQWNELPNQ